MDYSVEIFIKHTPFILHTYNTIIQRSDLMQLYSLTYNYSHDPWNYPVSATKLDYINISASHLRLNSEWLKFHPSGINVPL